MGEAITISIPKAMKEKLELIIKIKQVNRSEFFREALQQYFTKKE